MTVAFSTAVDAATDSLAVYRLTRLVTQDDITAPIRERIFQKLGDDHKLSELISCPWCSSVWLAGGASLARELFPKSWSMFSRAMATAAIAGIVSQQLNQASRRVELQEQETLLKSREYLLSE